MPSDSTPMPMYTVHNTQRTDQMICGSDWQQRTMVHSNWKWHEMASIRCQRK